MSQFSLFASTKLDLSPLIFMELEINLFWYPIEKHSFYIKYHLNIHFIPFYDKDSIKEL